MMRFYLWLLEMVYHSFCKKVIAMNIQSFLFHLIYEELRQKSKNFLRVILFMWVVVKSNFFFVLLKFDNASSIYAFVAKLLMINLHADM